MPEEVDELTFLFGVQTGPYLHSFGTVSGIDLHGLSILNRFESVEYWGHGQAKRH
jgi:hypothetical protein